MARSADRARGDARTTKAELLEELGRLTARVEELERMNSGLEGTNRSLGQSEGLLAALVEHMPAVAFVRDLEGRFTMVNRGYEETYAVSNDRVRGKTLGDVLPQEVAGEYAAHDRRVIAEQRVIEEEIVVERDGERHVLSAVKFPIRDTSGDMIAIGGIEQDITDRKKAEQEVEAQRAQLNNILGNIQQAVVLYDKDQRLVAWNSHYPDTLRIEEGVLEPGMLMYELTLMLAKRGHYGDGDFQELARRRVDDLWAKRIVDISFGDERSFDVQSNFTPDGGLVITYTDITERKKAETEIQQTKERLDLALEGSGEGLWDWNVKTGDQYMDERWARMLGYELDELDQDISIFGRLLHPEDKPKVMANLERILRSHTPSFVQDFRLRSKTGNWVWIVSRGKVTERDENGDPVRLIGTHTNITERKQAEEELAKKEAQFHLALDNMPGALVYTDQDLNIIFCNNRFREMYQAPGDLMQPGRPYPDFLRYLAENGYYGDGDVDALVAERVQSLRHPTDRTFEDLAPDGRIYRIRRRPVAAGGAVTVMTDITEQKQAEEELRQNEERLRRIFEDSPIAIAISLDDQSPDDGVIQFANSRFLKMLGFGSEQLGRARTRQIFSEGAFHEEREQALDDGETLRDMEIQVVRQDGEKLWTLLSLSPISYDGRQSALIWLYDISDRKHAETELRLAKEQAETALADLTRTQQQLVVTKKMASLGQLTAGIAHEIKNPLNFVNNFSETSVELLDDLKEVLEPVHEQFDKDTRDDVDDIVETLKGDLQKINNHGKRADSIVKSMLLHARGDTSERVSTSVNDLVEEAFNLAYHGERARDKSFQATMEQNLDDAAGQADLVPQEISRVLVNLFSNAFYAVKKRSQDAGPVDYAPTVAVWTEDKDRDVEIRVRDNGIGMPKEVREKLFDPFFTTKPTGEGTGLGLSMSFDIIVQQHGGRIDVVSEPGAFTEFLISVPRHPNDGQPRADKAEGA